jgi:hypothetical protein
MLWLVHEVIDAHHGGMIERCKVLGKVRAPHHPAALLAAFRKFKIKDNERQRRISIRPLKTKRRVIALLLFAGLLTGCNVSTGEGTRPDLSDNEAFALARKRVTESLKDPSSAQFGEFSRRSHSLGFADDRVCGTVNARNSFGGFTGHQLFAYRLANDRVVMGENAVINCTAPQ